MSWRDPFRYLYTIQTFKKPNVGPVYHFRFSMVQNGMILLFIEFEAFQYTL